MTSALLSLRDLRVTFKTMNGEVQAVRGVDIDVAPGEMVGVVGESGSGKSVTFLGIMGLLPNSARITGSAVVDGIELVGAKNKVMRGVRGKKIAMIFQDPLSALNPVYRVGDQIVEMIQSHQDLSKDAASKRAVELLDIVGIPQPKDRARQYPHEFSGGMRQRVMIAMAISNDPDLGVIARVADRVQVMYAGRVVERAGVDDLFERPTHPYTEGLLNSLPRVGQDRLQPIPGRPPNMLQPPVGCAFRARCEYATSVCAVGLPELVPFGPSATACVRASELTLGVKV